MTRPGPFWAYFGGKWRAAPRYPAPEHDLIVEPFAGAAGFATRYADHDVLLIDRDPNVVETWRWLIQATRSDVLALPLLSPGQHIDEVAGDLPLGARLFIGWWLNKGTTAPCKQLSAWATDERSSKGNFWGAVVRARVAEQVDAIKHWTVIEGSYEDAPDVEAHWFIDPPYCVAGKWYRFNDIDYGALAQWARARRGAVVVCEAEGADWLPFSSFAAIKANPANQGDAAEKGYSNEVIWTKGLPDTRRDTAAAVALACGHSIAESVVAANALVAALEGA